MKTFVKFIAFAFILVLSLRAEPTKISVSDCTELYVALSNLQPGLTPSNTGIAADDMNALLQKAKDLDAAKLSAYKLSIAISPTAPDKATQAQKIQDNYDSYAASVVTVDLTRFQISDDELKASPLATKYYAVIKRLLLPVKK